MCIFWDSEFLSEEWVDFKWYVIELVCRKSISKTHIIIQTDYFYTAWNMFLLWNYSLSITYEYPCVIDISHFGGNTDTQCGRMHNLAVCYQKTYCYLMNKRNSVIVTLNLNQRLESLAFCSSGLNAFLHLKMFFFDNTSLWRARKIRALILSSSYCLQCIEISN